MRTATFESTVDILVKAYLNDTLQHDNCHACAVGNIITKACGYSYKPNPMKADVKHSMIWSHLDSYFGKYSVWYEHLKFDIKDEESERQLKSTGYYFDDLVRIERAFESANDNGDRMFNGLMAVVDVLAEIHNVDLSIKENAKLLFVKSPN